MRQDNHAVPASRFPAGSGSIAWRSLVRRNRVGRSATRAQFAEGWGRLGNGAAQLRIQKTCNAPGSGGVSSLTASGNGEADPECLQLAGRACAADVRFRARNVDIRLAVTCGSRGNRVRVGARGASATP